MSTATLSAQEQENARINAENERLRKQATRKRRIGLGFSYFALILITILLVSFTPNAITQTWPPKLVPNQFTLENYQSLFERLPIGREMLNTVIFAGAVTIISVFFDSLAAYGLSRVDFKGRGLLLGVLIATMMIPGMALLIPVYKLLANMGLINSYWGIIIPAASVLHLHSEGPRQRGPHRRRRRIPHLRADHSAERRASNPHRGHVQLHGQLERPALAVDHDLQAGDPHHHRRPRNADRPCFLRHPVRCGDGRCPDLRTAVAGGLLLGAEALR